MPMIAPDKARIKKVYSHIGRLNTSLDLQGWGSTAPIFSELIQETAPSVIIEVGSYKGASACHMAKVSQRMESLIFCVDHWHDWSQERTAMVPRNWAEEVSTYHQFLFNVWICSFTDRIIPVKMSSRHAVGCLTKWGVEAELIYIDAGHDYETASSDIALYWELLRPGGVMFGHDTGMPEVMRAVCDCGRKFRVQGEHWVLEKKPGSTHHNESRRTPSLP